MQANAYAQGARAEVGAKLGYLAGDGLADSGAVRVPLAVGGLCVERMQPELQKRPAYWPVRSTRDPPIHLMRLAPQLRRWMLLTATTSCTHSGSGRALS